MFKETISIKKRGGVTTRTSSEMIAFLEEVEKERKKCSSNKKACINLGYSYDTFKNYKKKQNSKEGLVDKRRTKGLTEKHKELLGLFVCIWPSISLDAYFKLLGLRFPDEINRTRLYNFLVLQRMYNKKVRVEKIKEFCGGKLLMEETEEKLSFKWIHSYIDKRSEIERGKWKNKKDIERDENKFWVEYITKSIIEKGDEVHPVHINTIAKKLNSIRQKDPTYFEFKQILEGLLKISVMTEENAYVAAYTISQAIHKYDNDIVINSIIERIKANKIKVSKKKKKK